MKGIGSAIVNACLNMIDYNIHILLYKNVSKSAIVTLSLVSDAVTEQRIKDTLGITGLLPMREQIVSALCHLDVGSAHPTGEEACKG